MSGREKIKNLNAENENLRNEISQMRRVFSELKMPAVKLPENKEPIFKRINKLIEIEEHYNSLFYKNISKIFFINPETQTIIDANDSASNYYGYTKEEFIGMSVTKINTTSLDEIKAIQQEAIKTGNNFFYFKHKIADGQIRDVKIYTNIIYIDSKPIIVAYVHDITNKAEAEEALCKKNDEFENLYKKYKEKSDEYAYLLQKSIVQNEELINAKVKIEENIKRVKILSDSTFEAIILTEKNVIFDINNSAIEIFGYEVDEIVGKSIFDLISDEYKDFVIKKDREDNNENNEILAIKKNRDSFFAELRARSFDYEERRIRVFSFRDLTDRKNAEYELQLQNREYFILNQEYVKQNIELYKLEKDAQENRVRYETLANATIEAVILSVDGYIIESNASALEMFGYDNEEFNKLFITDIISEEHKEFIVNNFIINYTDPYELKCIKKSGKSFYAVIKEQTIDINGKKTRISTVRDISEAKKAQFELETQNKNYSRLNEQYATKNAELLIALKKAEESELLKSVFLANMSHEIRTPMNGIIGFIEMLKDKDITQEKHKQYLEIISRSSKQLLSVVSDILDISKIETGQVKTYSSRVSLNSLMRTLYADFEYIAEESNINFSNFISYEDEESIIVTDELKLHQILTNLLKNAFKFTHFGSVEFGYYFKDENVEFFVKDTGIGIESDIKDDVFKQFIQGDVSFTKSKGGTGLGLTIAKAYTELLGGNIRFESEITKGSTFFVRIPKVNTKSMTEQIKITPPSNLYDWTGYTFLIVEDNKVNYYFLHEVLLSTNVNMLYAETGSQALKFFEEYPEIDLILMDLKLPDISGYEVVKKIRLKNNNIPIIAQTAFAMAGDKKVAIESGCNDYIPKPIKKDELFSMIKKFI